MLSIFIIYSSDRLFQFQQQVECLREMEGYSHCQKILCSDGKSNFNEPDFELIEVTRQNKLFNWSRMWDLAVKCARFDNLLYLDSDRILPKDYLIKVNKQLKNRVFLTSKSIFRMKQQEDINILKRIRDFGPSNFPRLCEKEKRQPIPPNTSSGDYGKCHMSGNTAFTKTTFKDSGGVDPYYEGWGYPDVDYYMQTYKQGFKFKFIDAEELHIYHDYPINDYFFKLMNIWNGLHYCKKWNLVPHEGIVKTALTLGLKLDKLDLNESLESFLWKLTTWKF